MLALNLISAWNNILYYDRELEKDITNPYALLQWKDPKYWEELKRTTARSNRNKFSREIVKCKRELQRVGIKTMELCRKEFSEELTKSNHLIGRQISL